MTPDELPALVGDAEIAIIDHTPLPTLIAPKCGGLGHVVFLGTGARSYMNPGELAGHGTTVHIIKGYGDTAVAECAIALMWASARGFARMDRGMRAGRWLGIEEVQLTGKTLGLVGFWWRRGRGRPPCSRLRHERGRLEPQPATLSSR